MAQHEGAEAEEYLPLEVSDEIGEPLAADDIVPLGPPPLDASVADWVDQLREEPLDEDLGLDPG
jgi:hypothetical protein